MLPPPPHACPQTKAAARACKQGSGRPCCSGTGRAAASRSAAPASCPAIPALRGKMKKEKKKKERRTKNRPTENFSPLRLRAAATERIPTARLPSAALPEGKAGASSFAGAVEFCGRRQKTEGTTTLSAGVTSLVNTTAFFHTFVSTILLALNALLPTWRPSLLAR